MFNWADFLTLATTLVANGGDEAALRSAVSRSYYANYNSALARLITEGQMERTDPTQPGKHKFVWDLYRTSFDRRRSQIGIDGDRLRKSRQDSDYNNNSTVTQTGASAAVTKAARLYAAISRL